MPSLTIQLPNLPSVHHMLREEVITIGRMKGNTIALDDSSVSVSHAKITHKNGDFFLKDLNSTNGTMLNGQSINETRLRHGDQLKFGEVIAYYHAEPAFVSVTPAASASAAPAPAPTTQSALQPPPPAPVTAPPPTPVSSATFSNPSTSFVTKKSGLAGGAIIPGSARRQSGHARFALVTQLETKAFLADTDSRRCGGSRSGRRSGLDVFRRKPGRPQDCA